MVVDVIEKAMDGQYVLITTDEAGGTLIFSDMLTEWCGYSELDDAIKSGKMYSEMYDNYEISVWVIQRGVDSDGEYFDELIECAKCGC